MKDKGIFIFSEKLYLKFNIKQTKSIDEYYEFKKTQGYSEFEIAQKRSFRKCIIPYTEEENKNDIRCWIYHCETIFNGKFCLTFITIKK